MFQKSWREEERKEEEEEEEEDEHCQRIGGDHRLMNDKNKIFEWQQWMFLLSEGCWLCNSQ